MSYDWIAMGIVFVGTVVLMSQTPFFRAGGFAIMFSSNFFWYQFGVQVDSSAMVVMSAVFSVLNLVGFGYNMWCIKNKL